MINRKTLIGLAVATLVLFVAGGAIGEDNDVLWIVDDSCSSGSSAASWRSSRSASPRSSAR